MATFLIAHGAWSAAWAWKKMRPLLRSRGHELYTPTYTGLASAPTWPAARSVWRPTSPTSSARWSIEDLRDVVLVGHSYGGMVATGVADRARDRIRRLVYLDAFVPRDGQSLLDLLPADARERMREAARRPATAGGCRRTRCRPTRSEATWRGSCRAG